MNLKKVKIKCTLNKDGFCKPELQVKCEIADRTIRLVVHPDTEYTATEKHGGLHEVVITYPGQVGNYSSYVVPDECLEEVE